MKIRYQEKECEHCSKVFNARTYQRYCSEKCYNRARYERVLIGDTLIAKKECDVCKKEFQPIRFNVKRCSEVCRNIYSKNWNEERSKKLKEKILKNTIPINYVEKNLSLILLKERIAHQNAQKIISGIRRKFIWLRRSYFQIN